MATNFITNFIPFDPATQVKLVSSYQHFNWSKRKIARAIAWVYNEVQGDYVLKTVRQRKIYTSSHGPSCDTTRILKLKPVEAEDTQP